MLKTLIGDDHTLFREGLKRVLKEIPHIDKIEEACNGEEVLRKTTSNLYDLVILDISMPGRSGLDILKQLKCNRPGIYVLILSMHSEEEYAERALRAGASGYLTKESRPDELISAITKVVKGEKYVSSSLGERLANNLGNHSEKLLHETLSDREFEVMCMIASGKTVREIAEELLLSSKTISTHRMHILDKMRMKSNAQLTHYAIKNHLVN
ncbi:MAG: response regulator [Candidatus Hodarchaeales archaeon]|jgi:DNA-binding NarL/FixJ family response regulator